MRTDTNVMRCFQLLVLLGGMFIGPAVALGQVASSNESPDFSAILDAKMKDSLASVSKYVTTHPDAADTERAYTWLLKTATELGLEGEVVPAAEAYLSRTDGAQPLRSLARHVLCLGLAAQGKTDDALAVFDQELRAARFRTAAGTVDLGLALATRVRLKGELSASREVLESMATKFFLDAQVREMCESRMARIDLVNQMAPEIDSKDITGEDFGTESLKGKVVLIDFWATNCPPCLEEFPNLKELYAQYHEQGFEILGLSLDDDPSIVAAFQQQWDIDWPLIVDRRNIADYRQKYHVPKIPALFLVDRQGQIVEFDVRGKDLRNTVKRLVEAKQ